MHRERVPNLPDIDQEIEGLKQELMDRVRALNKLRTKIQNVKPSRRATILEKRLEEKKAEGQVVYDKYCKLQHLSRVAAEATEMLEAERECPHCQKLYHGN